MSNPRDFLYLSVRNECLNKGVSQAGANNAATKALNDFDRNRFNGKASKLIDEAVKTAIKLSCKQNKRVGG